MADISGYIRQIQMASRGEEVRDSIIGALNSINNSAGDMAKADYDDDSAVKNAGGIKAYVDSIFNSIIDANEVSY